MNKKKGILISLFLVGVLLVLDAFYLKYLADVVAGYSGDIIAIGPIPLIFGAIVGFFMSGIVLPKNSSISIRSIYILFCSFVTIIPTIWLYIAMNVESSLPVP